MDIRAVRRLYDIKSIVGMTGRKHVIVCPLPMHPHHSHTPSFSVFNSDKGVQLWKCHEACGLQGDVVDLMGYKFISGYNDKNPEHVKQAMSLLGITQTICPPRKEKKIDPLPNGMFRRYLPAGSEVLAYAKARGLTSETLTYFAVGQFNAPTTQWMTMPSFDGTRLMTLKLRNINSSGPRDRYQNYPGSVTRMFNINEVRNAMQPALIVKGEIVAMLLHQHGFLATAHTTLHCEFYRFGWLGDCNIPMPSIDIITNEDGTKRYVLVRNGSVTNLKSIIPLFANVNKFKRLKFNIKARGR